MPGAASSRSGCTVYHRRRPERTCLYQAVLGHLETYLALAREGQGERVAHHVEAQFRRYLECGILAHGFARARCGVCGHDFLIAFFCNVRPPGHHAERARAMGFCFFNNVAVGAAHALEKHGLERVAIVDFDVHHGNGTEDIFRDDPRVMMVSTFQHPFYPYSGLEGRTERMVNIPLVAYSGGVQFREAVEKFWIPALERFRPQMFFISAGFDAHRDDDMAALNLVENDYAWVTGRIKEIAEQHGKGRMVSTLEGGYALTALARSVAEHIRVLSGL